MSKFFALAKTLTNMHQTKNLKTKKISKRNLVLDDSGEVSMEVILGILVSIVLIAIVLNVLDTSVSTWMSSITEQFTSILGGDFGG